MRRRVYSGAEVVANVSARRTASGSRPPREMMATVRRHQCVIAYANMFGGQDGLIFDGGGFVCQNGRLLLDAQRFREGWQAQVVDLDRTVRLRAENTPGARTPSRTGRRPARPGLEAPGAGADRSALTYPVPPGRSFFLPGPGAPRDAREELADELLDALAAAWATTS